jgi:hypothetical protein
VTQYDRASGDVELRHGYTLAAVDRAVRICIALDHWRKGVMDARERRDLAWMAIIEHLYAAEEAPAERDLIHAGWKAVQRQVERDRSTHGQSHADPYSEMPYFHRYWWAEGRHTSSPEEGVVERIALGQIWAALSPRYRRALAALAAHEDHDKAAAALGITRRTYNDHLWAGRREFYQLWHEGEKPSRLWALDRRGSQHTAGVTHGVMHSIVRRRKLRRRRAAGTEGKQPPAATDAPHNDYR